MFARCSEVVAQNDAWNGILLSVFIFSYLCSSVLKSSFLFFVDGVGGAW
jgi:hypothetical protein